MAYLNAMKAIEKGTALVHKHRRYCVNVDVLHCIMEISDRGDYTSSMYSSMMNGFNIGFVQGFKAAKAEMKEGAKK